MTAWKPLGPPDIEPEAELQSLFDEWPNHKGWRLAGTPTWARELRGSAQNDRSRVATTLGYAFVPDVKWPGTVAELKSSSKYEPLGLAEVLHHAWMLRQTGGVVQRGRPAEHFRPVLISRWNGWNRASIAYLFEAGLPRDALRYLEVTMLRDGSDAIAWFDEPFATWQRCDAPPVAPPEHDIGKLEWFEVPEAGAWIGTTQPSPGRPVFSLGPTITLAAVDRGGHVAWVGANTSDTGKYYLRQ